MFPHLSVPHVFKVWGIESGTIQKNLKGLQKAHANGIKRQFIWIQKKKNVKPMHSFSTLCIFHELRKVPQHFWATWTGMVTSKECLSAGSLEGHLCMGLVFIPPQGMAEVTPKCSWNEDPAFLSSKSPVRCLDQAEHNVPDPDSSQLKGKVLERIPVAPLESSNLGRCLDSGTSSL